MATDVIKEFEADGVKYLELRSTPREEKNTGKHVNIEIHILIAGFIICLVWRNMVYTLFYFLLFPRIDQKEVH